MYNHNNKKSRHDFTVLNMDHDLATSGSENWHLTSMPRSSNTTDTNK